MITREQASAAMHERVSIFATKRDAIAWIYDCMAGVSGAQMHHYSAVKHGSWWVLYHRGRMVINRSY